MKINLLPLVTVVAALAVAPASAMQQDGEAMRRLGESIGRLAVGRSNGDAYNDQMMRNLERQKLQAEEYSRQWDERARVTLSAAWEQLGLPKEEARQLASAFVFDSTVAPIMARVKRDGAQGAVTEAVAAYRRYDYKLANTLLLCALYSVEPEAK